MSDATAAAQVLVQLPAMMMSMAEIMRTWALAEEWRKETEPYLYHAPGWGHPGFKAEAPKQDTMKRFLGSTTASQPYAGWFQRSKPYAGVLGGKGRARKQ